MDLNGGRKVLDIHLLHDLPSTSPLRYEFSAFVDFCANIREPVNPSLENSAPLGDAAFAQLPLNPFLGDLYDSGDATFAQLSVNLVVEISALLRNAVYTVCEPARTFLFKREL